MKIFRIHKKGAVDVGPYTGGAIGWNSEMLRRIAAKPEPREDGIGTFRYGVHHCGFASVQSLLDWFSAWCLNALFRESYCVSILEVPDEQVYIGRNQVAFHIDSAKVVKSIVDVSEVKELLWGEP